MVRRAPEYKVTIDVVIPTSRPVDARESFDGVCIGVAILDDVDNLSIGQGFVADRLILPLSRGVGIRVIDVRPIRRGGLRHHHRGGSRSLCMLGRARRTPKTHDTESNTEEPPASHCHANECGSPGGLLQVNVASICDAYRAGKPHRPV